jgi:hypothetical protein
MWMDVEFATSLDFAKLCVGPYIQNPQLIQLYVIINYSKMLCSKFWILTLRLMHIDLKTSSKMP